MRRQGWQVFSTSLFIQAALTALFGFAPVGGNAGPWRVIQLGLAVGAVGIAIYLRSAGSEAKAVLVGFEAVAVGIGVIGFLAAHTYVPGTIIAIGVLIRAVNAQPVSSVPWTGPSTPTQAGAPSAMSSQFTWGGPQPGYSPADQFGSSVAPPQYGAPQYGAPQYGAPQYGEPNAQGYPAPPQYGSAPQGDTPQYGAPQYGAPQYGAPQYGAPQYGTPQYGAPGAQYGAPEQPYGSSSPQPGSDPGQGTTGPIADERPAG